MNSEIHAKFGFRIRRIAQILLLAFMLGISNVILQETRMIEDSAYKIEMEQEDYDNEPFE